MNGKSCLIPVLIFVSAGVIDQDYRGNVGVVMFNFGDADFEGNNLSQNTHNLCFGTNIRVSSGYSIYGHV